MNTQVQCLLIWLVVLKDSWNLEVKGAPQGVQQQPAGKSAEPGTAGVS